MDTRPALSAKTIWIPAIPLILAVVEVFHPHPNDLLALDVNRWLGVHYSQLALFPLTSMALVELVAGRKGFAAAICRTANFVFAVSYIAFDTAAGVVTGILVKAAHQSGSPESWRPAVHVVWDDPIMGGSPHTPAILAVLGAVALSVGTVACAVSLKRSGHSLASSVLLGLSGFGIGIFRTHA